MTMIIKKYN